MSAARSAAVQARQPAREVTPVHFLPDSERLLRTHNAWIAEWDASNQEEEEPDFNKLVKAAFNYYSAGMLPIQVRWELAREYPALPARVLARAQRHAERALCAAESAPPELRRAMVAAARQRAIHGALAAGEWGAALRGLERAGEIAGELRESAGLSAEDLVLTVAIEGEAPPLPESQEGETGETEEGQG